MKGTELKTIKDLNIFNKEFAEAKQIELGELTDGYHTFDELYEFRKLYNAVLFNEWGNPGFDVLGVKYDVHKSKRHNDGNLCFGGGWFIVVAVLPTGQISNHYKLEDWDLFQIPETIIAKHEFDGHTPEDVMIRLKAICNGE